MAHKHTRHHKKRALPDWMADANKQKRDSAERRIMRGLLHQQRAQQLGVKPYVSASTRPQQLPLPRGRYRYENWNQASQRPVVTFGGLE